MLSRLLQAAAITCTIYLTMILSPSPAQQAVFLIELQRPAFSHLGNLLAQMIDLLLTPVQRDA